MIDNEKAEAIINGIEFARDWGFEIPEEDLELYEKLIKRKGCRNEPEAGKTSTHKMS